MNLKITKMTFLEKKIPPPIVAIIFAVIMKLAASYEPSISLDQNVIVLICSTLILIALSVDISALLLFRKIRTTVNPLKPSNTSKLVTNGVYKISRNPMYLGMALLLSAWGVYLDSFAALLFVPGFMAYITQFQIIPEELALTELFQSKFLDYKNSVRRWL